MKTIYDIFSKGLKFKKGLGEFGVEIETETLSGDYYPRDFFGEALIKETPHGVKTYWHPKTIPEWCVTEDGSLRDFGREFVFRNPLNYELAQMAVEGWGKATSMVKFTKDAPATSVHVHMNITEFTPVALANLLVLLYFFENLLTEMSGTIRRSNTFARPARCADDVIANTLSLFDSIDKGKKNAIVFSESQVKYGVINLASISTYGSVEIRSFRGTTNHIEIQDWLAILNRLYKFAQIPGLTPLEFYHTYKEIEEEIVDSVFGSDAEKLKCKDWKDWLRRNEFYLADLSTSIQNWNTFGSRFLEDKVAEKKTLSQLPIYDPFVEQDPQPITAGQIQALQANQLNSLYFNNDVVQVMPTAVSLDDDVEGQIPEWPDDEDDD